MEKLKGYACLEISSNFAKFAVGYVLNNQPILMYYVKKPLKGGLLKGAIADPKAIQNTLSSFLHIQDEQLSLFINGSSVSLVIPPLGFQVYGSNKTTNVVGETGGITKLDIANVLSLVKKDAIPNGNTIVDIVPDCFLLENGKMYANPPVGEVSKSLTVEAKIHTLPPKLVEDYRLTVENAGFRVKRTCVAAYCASQLIAADKEMPPSYIYVDMGARLTTVSLIGNSSPYGSLFIALGGDDLTEAIAESFNVSFADANILKEKYGYDQRKSAFQSPLVRSKDEEGKDAAFYQKDLNAVMESFYDNYDALLNNAIMTLIQKQPAKEILLALPLVLGGGASALYGLDKLLLSAIGKRKLIVYTPKVVGARDPGAINVLGLIIADGSYKGTLEDNYHGVSTLSRSRQEE